MPPADPQLRSDGIAAILVLANYRVFYPLPKEGIKANAKLFLVPCREIVDQSGDSPAQRSDSSAFSPAGKSADPGAGTCGSSND
jgi:hypothetical protein